MEAKPVYHGGWQFEDVIRQELEGPIGDGQVTYPNGDFFKGWFNLSYQSINNKAYTAHGRYTFADGAYIDEAWIETGSNNSPFPLKGVFRVHHPDGTQSIAMFYGAKSGVELFLGSKPSFKLWYKGEEQTPAKPLELVSYDLDESRGDELLKLTVVLKDEDGEWQIIQQGGKIETNSYDNAIYAPYIEAVVYAPNGDSRDYNYGAVPKGLLPYDGYTTFHNAETAQYRDERWENGQLIEAKEWQRDLRASEYVRLPHPLGYDETMDAFVWADGHIQYKGKEFVYDGEIADNKPEGQGVLVGDAYHDNARYEGIFHNGCLVPEEVFDGQIKLHLKAGHKHWSISGSRDWEYTEEERVAKLGKLDVRGFWNYEIVRITKDLIVISFYERKYYLTPDQPVHMYTEIEGHEYSDGCVYDGDDYTLDITWL